MNRQGTSRGQSHRPQQQQQRYHFHTDLPSTDSPVEDEQASRPWHPRGQKKGRGANQRRQESFRYQKNVATVRDVRAEIRARFMLPKDSPSMSVEGQAKVALDQRLSTVTVQRHVRTVFIKTAGVRELFEPIRLTLTNMKIQILDDEFRALIYVTARQISCKLFFAQMGYGSHNSWQLARLDRHRYTSAIFAECLRPLAIFISCIGRFEMFSQMNIPIAYGIVGGPTTNSIACQHLVENYDLHGAEGFDHTTCGVFQGDPFLDVHAGELPMAIDEEYLTTQYKNLMNKVARRNADAIVQLDLEKGHGSHVQLVGCCDEMNLRRSGSLCQMDVCDLGFGALFGFGLNNFGEAPVDPLHSLDTAIATVEIPRVGWAQEFCMCLYKTGT